MKILICGASGFIGKSLIGHLEQQGHTCVRGVRKPESARDIKVDYLVDTDHQTWLPRLQGIDAVINAVGIIRDTAAHPMQRIHTDTPSALFRACAMTDVKYVVNISALGVESGVETEYFRTKAAAEQSLLSHRESYRFLNLRPSLVYGRDGTSARMFRTLSALPVHVLPVKDEVSLQPVHVNDLCTAISNWLGQAEVQSMSLDVTGSEIVSYRGMLDTFRQQQGKGGALHIKMPEWVMSCSAHVGELVPGSPLCTDTLAMLRAGNAADHSALASLLGREPLGVSSFLEAG